jgi:probable rRNA maturation factor
MISVAASDDQADHAVDLNRWARLAGLVIEAEGVVGDAELSLLFVDEPSMAELNLQYMGDTGPTDVLSFPIDGEGVDDGGEGAGPPRLLGDVVICPAVAARNAPAHAGDYEDELALLVVHGVLHVLGLDHATADEEAVMHGRERRHLEAFHRSLPVTAWR